MWAPFIKGSQIFNSPTLYSQRYRQMHISHKKFHGAKEPLHYLLLLLFFSMASALNLAFIFITQLSSMESRSRYTEGPVLLNTFRCLGMLLHGFKLKALNCFAS